MIFSDTPSLTPIGEERLSQLVTRLLLHFRPPEGEKQQRIFARYMQALKDYPEDLLCAAYRHMLSHHSGRLPSIRELTEFMDPAMQYRRLVQQAIDSAAPLLTGEG